MTTALSVTISKPVTYKTSDTCKFYDNIRNTTCLNINKYLSEYKDFTEKEEKIQQETIIFLEILCYKNLIILADKLKLICVNDDATEALYTDIVHNLLEYIDKTSNIVSKKLIKCIFTDYKLCTKLLSKTFVDVNPEIWKTHVSEHKTNLNVKLTVKKYSKRYYHCNELKCVTRVQQCRCADEEADVIVTCTICGVSWKGS